MRWSNVIKVTGSIPLTALLICTLRARTLEYSRLTCASDAQGVLPCKRWWVTASQLNVPSLTPLSAVDCGRQELEATHRVSSVA